MLKKLSLIVLCGLLSSSTYAAEERPDFESEIRNNEFSVRTYSPMLVAGTTGLRGRNLFRTLADYIFGNNSRSEKIPMTAPVFSTNLNNAKVMMFFMPKKFEALKDLPRPMNPRVKLTEFELGRVAVITYRGYNSEEKAYLNYQKLLSWLKSENLEVLKADSYFTAGYDSPWVPERKRTNEILVQIK
jgi:effector-binding domain-containing protein